jgi:hypothetical protein
VRILPVSKTRLRGKYSFGSRNTSTSAVSVENKTLLVPLSKMMVRRVLSNEVVLPLTDIPGDRSSQLMPVPAWGANTRSPVESVLNLKNSFRL